MDKCTDGMDKCRKCIALGLPSPTDYGMGGWCKALLKPAVKARDDCHLTTSDMEAIKAAIAGGGRLRLIPLEKCSDCGKVLPAHEYWCERQNQGGE